jgi:hypothetical protein
MGMEFDSRAGYREASSRLHTGPSGILVGCPKDDTVLVSASGSQEARRGKDWKGGQAMILMFILMIVVIVAAVGALPIWRHSKDWGFYPISGVSVIILIILVLLLFSHFHRH